LETSEQIPAPKPYLTRNKDIVRDTEMLVAAPADETEVIRSGTWSTVRAVSRGSAQGLKRYPVQRHATGTHHLHLNAPKVVKMGFRASLRAASYPRSHLDKPR